MDALVKEAEGLNGCRLMNTLRDFFFGPSRLVKPMILEASALHAQEATALKLTIDSRTTLDSVDQCLASGRAIVAEDPCSPKAVIFRNE